MRISDWSSDVCSSDLVKTNVEGRALGRVGRIPATAGADLRLAVDVDLQRTMVEAFGDHDGAAVAIDPDTGGILAMVSLPSYDPKLFVNGLSSADYRALMDNPSRPLFNRHVLRGGPPAIGRASCRERVCQYV